MIKVNSTLLARTLSLVSQSAKTLMDIVQDSRTKFGGIIQVTKSKIVLTAAFFFNAFYRDVPDTVGITDSKTATLTKALENSYQVQDDHFANFSKNRFDVFNVSDTTSLQVDFYRSFFDTAQIEDASFANLAKPLANSFSIGDSFGTVNQFYRSFDSVVSFTDDVNGAALDDDQNVTYWKVLTNSFNVADSVSQSNQYYRAFDDSYTIVDSNFSSVEKVLTNTFEIGDASVQETTKSLSNSFNLQDSISQSNQYYRSFDDSSLLTDSHFADTQKVLADTFNLSDSLVTANQFYRDVADTTSFTDDVNGAALDDDQNVTYWKVLTNSFNVADSVSQSNQYYRIFEDGYIAGDLQYSLYGKNLTNEFNLEDTHSIINVFYRDFNSSVSFTDDINGAALDDDQNVTYWKVLTNNFNVVDTVSNYSTKPLYHNINLIESFSAEPAKNLQNSFAVTDSLVASIGFLPTLFDNFSLSDVRYNLVGKALSSGAGFGESINTFGLTKALTSSLNITDDINGAAVDDDQNVVYFKNTSNLFTVNEINIKLLVKGLADSIGITSTGIILTQSFASDPMYFGEDFIGSQTNI